MFTVAPCSSNIVKAVDVGLEQYLQAQDLLVPDCNVQSSVAATTAPVDRAPRSEQNLEDTIMAIFHSEMNSAGLRENRRCTSRKVGHGTVKEEMSGDRFITPFSCDHECNR
ncbi:hypothetical protein ACJQWK_02017 [Exserohilum turcicum]